MLEERLKHYEAERTKTDKNEAERIAQLTAGEAAKKQFRWAVLIAIVSGILGMLQGAWALFAHK